MASGKKVTLVKKIVHAQEVTDEVKTNMVQIKRLVDRNMELFEANKYQPETNSGIFFYDKQENFARAYQPYADMVNTMLAKDEQMWSQDSA